MLRPTKPFTFRLLASTAILGLFMAAMPIGFDLNTDILDKSAYAKDNNNGNGNGKNKDNGKSSDKGKNTNSDKSTDKNTNAKNDLGKLNAAHASATGLSNASSNSAVGAIAEGNAEEIANKPMTDSIWGSLMNLLEGKEINRETEDTGEEVVTDEEGGEPIDETIDEPIIVTEDQPEP